MLSDRDEFSGIAKTEKTTSISARLDSFGWFVLRWWGIIFRIMFIPSVGTLAVLWLNPLSIMEVPLTQVTPEQIFRNLFAGFIVLGSISWFFSFPEVGDPEKPESNPYVAWGQFGALVMLLGFWGTAWLSSR